MLQLLLHLGWGGRAIRPKRLDGVFHSEQTANFRAKLRVSISQLGIREIGQALYTTMLAQAYQPANDLVGRALGDISLDQEFHQSRRVKKPLVEPFRDPLGT